MKPNGWVEIGENAYAHPDALDKLRKELFLMSIQEPERFKALFTDAEREGIERDKGE